MKRISFTVNKIDLLYMKRRHSKTIPDSFVYRIVDENKNIYIWSTLHIIEKGDTITATISGYKKAQNRFTNGSFELQTILTRGKVLVNKIEYKLRNS